MYLYMVSHFVALVVYSKEYTNIFCRTNRFSFFYCQIIFNMITLSGMAITRNIFNLKFSKTKLHKTQWSIYFIFSKDAWWHMRQQHHDLFLWSRWNYIALQHHVVWQQFIFMKACNIKWIHGPINTWYEQLIVEVIAWVMI